MRPIGDVPSRASAIRARGCSCSASRRARIVVVVGFAAVRHRLAVQELEAGRVAEAESFARILQGLSRSVSADAIVRAIIEDLGSGTGADHVVIVRRRPDARVLEATLVNARTGGSTSSTLFPIADLEDPPDAGATAGRDPVPIPIGEPRTGGSPAPALVSRSATDRRAGADRRGGGVTGRIGAPERIVAASRGIRARPTDPELVVADRIAARARSVFGLRHTLAAPLTAESGIIGAIVISQRTATGWPPSAQRLLAGAAAEASSALARAYSHRQAEARASTDALTGLPNRRYFDEVCALFARRRRTEDAVGVLMIDIDRFKVLNDTYGHGTGDEVLRAVAGAIASAIREDDVPARFGGEEFAVLLRNPSREIAVEVGERVREAVGSLDLRRFGVPAVSVSVGVAVAEDGETIGSLVEAADRALYDAKRRGRDRVVAA
jgi:diguanylate cyclase (GGDEF)-like protein